MVLLFILAFTIPPLLILLNLMIIKRPILSREKFSPFECGFDPKTSSRTPFSLKFYLISIMFLIFDIEIALILPIPIILNFIFSPMMNFLMVVFLLVFLGGLFYEWKEGALKWLS